MSLQRPCADCAPPAMAPLVYNEVRYATRADAELAIKEYIEIFYNRQRCHSRLGYVSPAQFAKNISKTTLAA